MQLNHETINTILLVVLAIGFFIQNTMLRYMKTAMDAVDPAKIKTALEIINESKEHELKLKLSKGLRDITQKTSERFQEVNQSFYAAFDELIRIPFGIMKDMNWEDREKHLVHYPKNAEWLRATLEAYDKGEFPPKEWAEKK